MNDTPIPRTDEWETYCDESYYHLWRVRRKNERGFNDGYHVHNGDGARALVDLLNKQDSELNAARAEIERLDTAGIHSCHKNCQRPNCVLRRERDELATCLASEKITRNHIIERASETEREIKAITEQRDGLKQAVDCANDLLASVTEQRDRLAEALEYVVDDLDFEICERIGHSDKWCSLITAREALQSLTTNAKTIYGEKGSTP